MENMESIRNNKTNQELTIQQSYYSCDKCNNTPKIIYIDYRKNEIQFNCDEHKINTLKINDYLECLSENDICQNCFKKKDNDDCSLFYCFNCKLIFCNKCANEHKKNNNHYLINNEDYNIICKKHTNEYYIGYCSTCKENICKECKKTRKHKEHQKFDYIEIEPRKEDFNVIYNFNCKIENEINNCQKLELNSLNEEKDKEIQLISQQYSQIFEQINKKYEEIIKKYVEEKTKEKEKELSEKINSKNDEINIIICQYRDKEKDYKKALNNKIVYYKNIIKLNTILVNSYKKQKKYNLYYNENINKVIESINKYNKTIILQDLNQLKEKYKISLNNENTSLNIQNDKLDNQKLSEIFNYKFNKLKEIKIFSKILTSIDFLAKNQFDNLEKLTLVSCPISDINALSIANLNSLRDLKISKANITNIDCLKGDNLMNLELLDLSKNQINNIDIFNESKFNDNLLELYLNNNKINDISVFNKNIFNNLKTLFLSYNVIEDISPLQFILINSCESLSLDNNKISNIDLFNNIKIFFEIKALDLSNNPIDFDIEKNKNIIKNLKAKKNFKFFY